MAPSGTPPAILAKIEADIGRVAAMPDVRKKRDGAGLDMLVMSSGDMMRLIRADAEKYGKAAKLAGIKAEWAGPPAQPPGPPVCAVQRATLAARQSARLPVPAFLREWLRFVAADALEEGAANATILVSARHQPSSVQ